MSFSSTPLGQDRRLDHQAFLKGAPYSYGANPPPPKRVPSINQSVPISYVYGYALISFSPSLPCFRVRNLAHAVLRPPAELPTWLRDPQTNLRLLHIPDALKVLTTATKKYDAHATTTSSSVTNLLPVVQVRPLVRESSLLPLSQPRPHSIQLQLT